MSVRFDVKFMRHDADVAQTRPVDDAWFLAVLMTRVVRGLAQWGGYVQRTARNLTNKRRKRLQPSKMPPLMKQWYEQAKRAARRKGRQPPPKPWASSEPGQPPRKITGALTYNIKFDVQSRNVNATKRSVLVGPEAIKQPPVAPRTLEEGGTATFPTRTFASNFTSNRGGRKKLESTLVTKTHLIQPRPYMRVAMKRSFTGGNAGRFFGDIL